MDRNFDQLKQVLDYTFDPDERKILLEAMAQLPGEVKKQLHSSLDKMKE